MKSGNGSRTLGMLVLGLAVGLAGCAGVASKPGDQNPGPSAPTISVQPSNQTVTVGQAATFTVVVTGTTPLSYQWQKNGTTIAGATSSSYTTSPTTAADNGAKFQVEITNSAGSTTSNAVILSVSTATLQSIAVTPSNPSISPSKTQQFTATGTYSDGSTKNITTTVTWASSNNAVATIGTSTGLATGITAGTSQITATLGSVVSPGGALTVTTATLQSILITPSTTLISPSKTQQFTATGTYSDGSTKNITTTVTWASSNNAVATIGTSTGLATGVTVGTSQITATLGSVVSPGGALTVTTATLQSILITPSTTLISPSKTQQFTATGTYSDGSTKNITTTVTWASSNNAVATIGTSTGLATGVTAGTSQITATLGSVVSPNDTLTVTTATLQSIAVTPSNPSISPSKAQQFTATGTYSDGSTKNITTTVTWASSNNAVATIGTSTGLATGVTAGTSQITATLGSVVSPNDTLTVTTATLQSIAVTPSNPSISASKTQQFTATGTYSDGSTKNITTTVTWASSNNAVATIGTSTGLATGITAGTSQITATLGSVVSTNDTLTVTTATLQSIAVTPSNPSISPSKAQQFAATGTYSDGSTKNITTTVTWASSNNAVATIGTSTGLATGVTAGTSQITATLGSVVSLGGALTVTTATLQSIAVTPSNPSISPSKTQQFAATGTYSDGSTKNITTTVTWASSNNAVATIGTSTGLATGVTAGTSQITATLGSVVSLGGALTVTAATLQSIAVTPSNPSISPSKTQQFTATGTYSDGSTKNITTTVTWASSNNAVATIGTSTGLATGVTAGTSQITATLGSVVSPGGALTVTAATLQSIAVTPSNPSISPSKTQQFTATGTYSDGSTKNITTTVTWASSNNAVATIGTSTGLATGVTAGTSQITATLGSVVSPNDTLTVTAATLQSIAVTPSNPSISPSKTQQFAATGTYSDGSTKNITTTVTWASSNNAVATIGTSTGLATGVTAGTSQITATLGSVVSLGGALTVTAATLQSIAVTPSNPSISPSKTQQFTATGTYSDGSTKNITTTVTWTSSNNAVATIGTSTGLATGVTAGTSQITATLGSVVSPGGALTVTAATLQSIAVTPSNPSISSSKTQQFTATGTYSDGSTKNITTTVTWASSNNAVATIGTSTGLATGVTAGTSQITATLGSVVSPNDALTVTATTGNFYTTNFPLTENPISESGKWINGGVAGWLNVRTTPGHVFGIGMSSGCPDNSASCNDPTAVLSGTWGANQTVQGTVYVNPSLGTSCCHEVELRLRTTITANRITGYEINCSVSANGYLQLVRWDGALGNWRQLNEASTSCVNGDVLSATANGSTITVYKNGVQQFVQTDATYSGGSPGVGFFDNIDANLSNFGFSSFTASDTTSSVIAATVRAASEISPGITNASRAAVDVVTYHNDVMRTGLNSRETVLTPSNVNSANFGKVGEFAVDSRIDGQILYLSQLNVPGKGTKNVLYFATEKDTVYAVDADSINGSSATILWKTPALGAGETAVPLSSLPCGNIDPNGITATPVIDRARNAIYVVTMSTDNKGNYFHRLHALDLTTGKELFGGPTTVDATYPGTGGNSSAGTVTFLPQVQSERAALLETGNKIYTVWSGHSGDCGPYSAWVMAFDAGTLAQTSVTDLIPNAFGAGIWLGGSGPASDASGDVYFSTGKTFGNNTPGSNNDYGNTFVRLSGSNLLSPVDYFAPSNALANDNTDKDFSSSGPLLLPDLVDSTNIIRHLAVVAGEDGVIYVVDRDKMGQYNASKNNVYQQLPGDGHANFSSPVYFNNTIFIGPSGLSLRAYPVSQALLATSPSTQSAHIFGNNGTVPSVSSDANQNGIVWALDYEPGILFAYDATDLTKELYNSTEAGNRDHFSAVAGQFITPLVVDGKVYFGTGTTVAAFGVLGQ